MGSLASKSRPKPATYHVGDSIGFKLGVDYRNGIIVEERGPLAVGGRELYGVRINRDPEQIQFDLPIDEIKARFPANEPSVTAALEDLIEAIVSYKSVVNRPEHDDDLNDLRDRRKHVREAFRDLLIRLKATAQAGADLGALEASIPADVRFDANVALVNEPLPKMSQV